MREGPSWANCEGVGSLQHSEFRPGWDHWFVYFCVSWGWDLKESRWNLETGISKTWSFIDLYVEGVRLSRRALGRNHFYGSYGKQLTFSAKVMWLAHLLPLVAVLRANLALRLQLGNVNWSPSHLARSGNFFLCVALLNVSIQYVS